LSKKLTKTHSNTLVIKTALKPTKKTLQVLKVLSKSERPLSSRDIEKEVVKVKLKEKKISGSHEENRKQDRDVYKVIKNKLCIQKFNYGFFLFDWNKLLSSIDEKLKFRKDIDLQRVVENLNKISLKLNASTVEFIKNEDGSEITIKNVGSTDPRLIKIQRESKDYANLSVFKDGKKVRISTPLIIKEVRSNPQVFYEGFQGNPAKAGTSYLNTSLNENASKKLKRIESMNPDLFNCTNEIKTIASKCLLSELLDDTIIESAASEIKSNTRNLEYSMNIRGLVMYILGINEGKDRNIEVSEVLQNLSENYKAEFPFLIHYKEIKELYDKLATEKGIQEYEYFHVKIIRQIAQELQYSLDTIDKEDLNYYLIKRYSEELTWRYMTPLNLSPLPLPAVIQDYYVYTQECIRNYLEKELQDTKSRIEYMFPISY
jgi:hypothetical protein